MPLVILDVYSLIFSITSCRLFYKLIIGNIADGRGLSFLSKTSTD